LPPEVVGFQLLLRQPPKRHQKEKPSSNECRLPAPPSSTTEAASKGKTFVQRVSASSSSFVNHRSDFKRKNLRPTGVGFQFLSLSLPKQLPGEKPSTNEVRIPISPMSTTEVIATEKTFLRAKPVSTPPQPVSSGNHQRSSLHSTVPTSDSSSANLRRGYWRRCHLSERVSIRPGFFTASC
jgi:hypothetical protein